MPLAFNTLMNVSSKEKHTCDYLNTFLEKQFIGAYKAIRWAL